MSDLKEASRENGNSISLSPNRSQQVPEIGGKIQTMKKSTIGLQKASTKKGSIAKAGSEI